MSLTPRPGRVNAAASGLLLIALLLTALLLSSVAAWAAGDQKTITGVVSKVDPVRRIATVTPANGAPIFVQFAFDAGGPCSTCLGSGRSGPTFTETITEGSTWTITYTVSVPEGKAAWFPGGTVNTVYKAVPAKAAEPPKPN